jgi:S1-C subfamily serine protease
VELDGRPIEGVGDLQRLMVGEVVGRPIGVEVERDGSMLALRVTPAELA